jgi:rhodanese-related sulfurtransferase
VRPDILAGMMNRPPLRWLFLLFVAAWLAPSAGFADEGVDKISPAVAAQQMKEGKAVLVDVRERGELDAGMAEGAHWYPTSSIQADPAAYQKFIAALPPDQTVVFYCAVGGRAGAAAEIASKDVGRKAANLGGFKDWKAAGLPVKTPAKSLQPG